MIHDGKKNDFRKTKQIKAITVKNREGMQIWTQ